MKNKTIIILTILAVVGLGSVGTPIVSALTWKSTALEKTNMAVDAINSNIDATNNFNNQNPATEASYNELLTSLKNERTAMQAARNVSQNVGGFRGVDIFGTYRKAEETGRNLTSIYDELLAFNAAEISRMEVDKLLTLSFKTSDQDITPAALKEQAQSIRNANDASQHYLKTEYANDVDRKFSEILTRMADSFDSLADAQNSGNVSQISASAHTLEGIVNELELIQGEVDARSTVNQQRVQSVIDRLNATAEELV